MNVLNKLISGTDHMSPSPLLSPRQTKGLNAAIGSSLYQIPMPDGLKDKTYGALVKLLASRGILAIGLLRGLLHNMHLGPKGNKMVYVYTNPSKDTEVFSCDRVFVLSQKVLGNKLLFNVMFIISFLLFHYFRKIKP